MNGNEHLWRQFEKLGEMMGDGLHHEADGKWISVEYKKLEKILCPEGFAEIRKQKSEALNKAIQKKIEIDKCPNCEGKFKQSRSGSSVVVCLNCKKKYKYKKSKK